VTVALAVEDLWVEAQTFGNGMSAIVKGVSFEVKKGQVVALIGESGAGKSTVALSTMGYARPGCRISGGRIMLGDSDILSLDVESRRSLRGRTISYVAQSAGAAFNPSLRIGQQVTESVVLHNLMRDQDVDKRAVELYRLLELPDPENLGRRYPHQVSGGQLQRLMIAMAILCSPEVLLLDEPTTALDVTTQVEVLKAIKEIIKEKQTAAVYVSHDLAVVAQVADHIIVLRDGEMVEDGKTGGILHQPKAEYSQLLMDAVRQLPPPEAFRIAARETKPPEAAKGTVIEVQNISATYERHLWHHAPPKNLVLHGVSLTVPRERTVAVVGESGCGKSTLARVISGLLPPVSGQILFEGERPLPPILRDRARNDLRHIQIVFQDPDVSLNPRQRVREILGRPLEFYLGLGAKKRQDRVAEILAWVELPADFASRYPGELSGGERQRVSLARALAAEPDIILCDEVISSLDTVVGAAVLKLLARLQERLGIAYLFISHDLATVGSISDYVVVIYAGHVVEQGPTNRVFSPPHHPYTRLLLSSVPALRQGWLEEVLESRAARSGLGRFFDARAPGCPFFNRCSLAIPDLCDRQHPPLIELPEGHTILCHHDTASLNDKN
jgi:peptide/nickel transport system ATP-binding protein